MLPCIVGASCIVDRRALSGYSSLFVSLACISVVLMIVMPCMTLLCLLIIGNTQYCVVTQCTVDRNALWIHAELVDEDVVRHCGYSLPGNKKCM